MLSRRLIRIKVMHLLYAFLKSEESNVSKGERELSFSLNKTMDLYHYILLLLTDVSDYAENKIETAKNKKITTYRDLNPNTKFIENKIINQIKNCKQFRTYLEQNKMSWVNYPEFIKSLYTKMNDSVEYGKYMTSTVNTYKEDQDFVFWMLEDLIGDNDDLYSTLEDQSIYWNDDIEFVISMIIKTIDDFKENQTPKLMPLFRNDDDESFAKELFRKSFIMHDKNVKIVESYVQNWELDRIAGLDILLMEMAITEVLSFPSVPIKVTINEYIEIAKFYSTTKSGQFVNGILDKIINDLKKDNKIIKSGRGLIE